MGIEANPDNCSTILSVCSPTNMKEEQRLVGWLTSLSRFLPKLTEDMTSVEATYKGRQIQLGQQVWRILWHHQGGPILHTRAGKTKDWKPTLGILICFIRRCHLGPSSRGRA